MAMLRTLCDEGYAGEVGFLNYARSPELALYETELQISPAPTEGAGRAWLHPDPRWPAPGRFDRGHLSSVISDHAMLRRSSAARRR